jgi:hypothetical protein
LRPARELFSPLQLLVFSGICYSGLTVGTVPTRKRPILWADSRKGAYLGLLLWGCFNGGCHLRCPLSVQCPRATLKSGSAPWLHGASGLHDAPGRVAPTGSPSRLSNRTGARLKAPRPLSRLRSDAMSGAQHPQPATVARCIYMGRLRGKQPLKELVLTNRPPRYSPFDEPDPRTPCFN